ncbi:MAG: protein translocase SEC61 complex subunit gamma [Candidatus Hodarchaeales archaeon]
MGFFSDSMRLIRIARKPSRKEIWVVIKVTVVGMALLGLLGFIILIVGNVIIDPLVEG